MFLDESAANFLEENYFYMDQLSLTERRALITRLGDHLRRNDDEFLHALQQRTYHNNLWFTLGNQQLAVRAIAEQMLEPRLLDRWLSRYTIPEQTAAVRTVGIIPAGNIPLVGFHDVLCVFLCGHRSLIKPSTKDAYVLPYLLKLLGSWDERAAAYFELTDRLSDFDAVIATGSNNSARYFETYFGKVPHIIRRNRNAVAVLTGRETDEQLTALGEDIFTYFGMGCRNVAKLYLPRGYDLNRLLEILHEHRDLVRHSKYKNNFDYNFAVFTLNNVPFYNNGCVMLVENEAIQSRIAALHYAYYDSVAELREELQQRQEEVQVVVSGMDLPGIETVAFGQAQQPLPWQYPDGVDVVEFLLGLEAAISQEHN